MPKTKEIDDARFSQIDWHPKFRRVPRQIRKVKIDKRFESMFKDPSFKLKHAVDKRGRPLGHTSTEDLRRYYDMPSSDSESSEGDDDDKGDEKSESKKKSVYKPKHGESKEDEKEDEGSEDASEQSNDEKKDEEGIKLDLARGEGNISSSSEDSSSEWEFQEDEAAPLHDWADVDTNRAPTTDSSTSRLAICNMDWERITARDLLILLNSFKPLSGVVRCVRVYPSDFGLQRMNEEKKCGPTEFRELKMEPGEEGGDEEQDLEEGEKSFLDKSQEERRQKILLEKLRQYEFNRLKYYYAVAECDSVETAEFVYSNCDGMEYEASGTRLDLRFVPDDMEFDRKPKDEATSFGDLSDYRPNAFVNKALQQSRPILTWEEERDPKRAELTRKAFENPQAWDRLELNGVLASPSSSEASDNEEHVENDENGDVSYLGENSVTNSMENLDEKNEGRSKDNKGYKSLLLDSLKKLDEKSRRRKEEDGVDEDDVEMEIRWDANVRENLDKTENPNQKEDDKKKTQWEKYLERRKEKRRQRKEEARRKRLAVKRQRQTYADDGEDDFPSDFEDDAQMGGKSKKPRKRPKLLPGADDSEEKKKQEAELELLLADSDEDTKRRHFSLKKLLKTDARKAKTSKTSALGNKAAEEEEEFTMNLDDPRFKAVFDSHLYSIDPSDPAFKKTPGMKRLVEEKFKSKAGNGNAKSRIIADQLVSADIRSVDAEIQKASMEKTVNPELSVLAKRVKAKTDLFKKERERRSVKKS